MPLAVAITTSNYNLYLFLSAIKKKEHCKQVHFVLSKQNHYLQHSIRYLRFYYFCMNNSSCQVHLAGRHSRQHGIITWKLGAALLKLLSSLTVFHRSLSYKPGGINTLIVSRPVYASAH